MDTIKVYIYGAGGHGKVIKDILEAQGYFVSGFIDDDLTIDTFSNLPVFRLEQIKGQGIDLILGIGDNKTRKIISRRINENCIIAKHPSAIISDNASIGIGSVVMQLCTIQTGSMIGKYCIINTKASVDHDCIISDYVHISPGATICGNVKIGELTWIGAGATIIQGLSIGSNCVIGAGSVILNDIPDNLMVAGNPATVKKRIN